MSIDVGTYSFLPWLRQGIANRLQAAGNNPGTTRATIRVALKLEGDGLDGTLLEAPIQKDVQIYGPGDIVGIDQKAIVKVEPRRWITNFEPNYLPYIEFYDEDFPWRYTPEVPANHRLRPWIMLVVLKEDEFEEGAVSQDRPLPFITISGADSLLPPIDQVWAWAHVHINRDLGINKDEIVSTDMNAVLPKFAAILQQNPDLAYSRIVSPRYLAPSTTYHAFIIPLFESGRLAGLGFDPTTTPSATHGAWQPNAGKAEVDNFPYYYRWTFQTGTVGDFEYLLRLLEPKPVDNRVGQRDMDVQDPGSNITPITNEELGGVLRLGGALRIPLESMSEADRAVYDKYEQWDEDGYPQPFQSDLAAFVNLADDYNEKTTEQAHADTAYDTTIPDPDHPGEEINDPDPLITPPLYGRWHALYQRILKERDGSDMAPNNNWMHELNLDPRYRVSAAFGTLIIQENQETYMNAAWEQIGDVLEANRRIRLAQLAKLVSKRWYTRTVLPMQSAAPEKAFTLTKPVQKRIIAGRVTAFQQVETSIVPHAITSTAARRIIRPRGRLMKALPFDTARTPTNLITRINAGEVTASPPKAKLEGAPTLDRLADLITPPDLPPFIKDLLDRYPRLQQWLMALIILLLLSIIFFSPLIVVVIFLVFGAAWLIYQLRKWQQALAPSDTIREDKQTPDAVDRMPKSPDFRLIEPGEEFTPTFGTTDSVEAAKYKVALKEAYTLIDASRRADVRPERPPLDLPALTGTVVAGINPDLTIPRHTYHGVFLPPRIREQIGESFVEVMAYPEIDFPMYKPLADKSAELFLPNIQFIEQNTISLLETNQPFIEAYMVGLNHEFGRELLWREYFTDQRGSYFRQFWDVSGFMDSQGLSEKALREKLKDIPPIHRWSKASTLGQHDNRETGGEDDPEVVLVIRGELLKKYPTAVIYAHRADWQRDSEGNIRKDKERRLREPEAAELEKPPRDKVKTPLYEAKVNPDIYFFGFDLTVKEALGGPVEGQEEEDPGWFFVIKERPGEPRFGLDIGKAENIYVWNDLAWENIILNAQPGDYIEITNSTPEIQVNPSLPPDLSEQAEQAVDDRKVRWHNQMDAAELAYILYQVPVMVAIHASEMLPKQDEG